MDNLTVGLCQRWYSPVATIAMDLDFSICAGGEGKGSTKVIPQNDAQQRPSRPLRQSFWVE